MWMPIGTCPSKSLQNFKAKFNINVENVRHFIRSVGISMS